MHPPHTKGQQLAYDWNGTLYSIPLHAEVAQRLSAYAVIPLQDERILMCCSTWHNLWEFPGGGVDLYESPQAAVQRECQEELDLRVTINPKWPLYVASSNFKIEDRYYHSIRMYFGTEPISPYTQIEPQKEHKTKEAKFMRLKDTITFPLNITTRDAIANIDFSLVLGGGFS
jgi:ADP-ribose pyrophosphatase YjhB (NUDIX family)